MLLHFFFSSLPFHLEKRMRKHEADFSILIKEWFECAISDQHPSLLLISLIDGDLCSNLSLIQGKKKKSLTTHLSVVMLSIPSLGWCYILHRIITMLCISYRTLVVSLLTQEEDQLYLIFGIDIVLNIIIFKG